MRPIATLLALLAAGCSLVPKYHRPDTKLPSAWSASEKGAAPVDPTWWTSFRSDELDALMKKSASGNFDLQAAYARVEEARAKAQIAGAPMYPSVDAVASVGGSTNASSNSTSGLFVQASYEVDFWGKNRAGHASALALVDASAFDAQTVAVTLEASVADTYFAVLSLQERVALAQQIAADARRMLSLVEAQAAGGIASQLEVEQQRNALATFAAAIPALEQQREEGLHQLAILTGQTPESLHVDGTSAMKLAVPEAQAGLPSTVLERRPDIRAAEARLVSANFDIGRARAAFFPSFTLTAAVGVGASALESFFPLASLVAQLVQPIYKGGALRGQLRYDRAHAVELAAMYRQAVIASLRDVEDALTEAQRSRELESQNQVAVDSARRAAELARARYEAGTVDFLTVLTVERTLYQAEDAQLTTRLSRLQAAVALFRALGGGFGTDPGRTS